MYEKTGRTITFIIVLVLALNLAACGLSKNSEASTESDYDVTILTREEALEDLEELERVISKVHPATIEGLSAKTKSLIEAAKNNMGETIELDDFYFKVQDILCSLKDAHTSTAIYSPLKGERTLNVSYAWLYDGLYVTKDIATLMKGDKVLAIGGKSVEALFDELSRIIPHENDIWVRGAGESMLNREYIIKHIGLINEDSKIDFEVLRNGSKINVSAKFDDLKGNLISYFPEFKKDFTYDILKEDSIGLFTLNTCKYNNKYKAFVKKFFTEVRDKKIQNIIVDLRNNSGGNSQVTDEFLTYFPIKQYKSFGGYMRLSHEANEQRSYEFKISEDSKKNKYEFPGSINVNELKDEKLLFNGDLYIINSKYTFSSANWFGVIVKDNKLGTIVGEPTGNSPSSYGDILRFELKNSKIDFRVSHKCFIRPDEKNTSNTLEPDVLVETTISDILNNHDSQLEKVKELIKAK
ncbi:MAG: S41 family peptidase [Bacillota bacterium]